MVVLLFNEKTIFYYLLIHRPDAIGDKDERWREVKREDRILMEKKDKTNLPEGYRGVKLNQLGKAVLRLVAQNKNDNQIGEDLSVLSVISPPDVQGVMGTLIGKGLITKDRQMTKLGWEYLDKISSEIEEGVSQTTSDVALQEKANFCPNCGKRIEVAGEFCADCGHRLTGGVSLVTTAPISPRPLVVVPTKNGGLAALLSAFIPGGGQIYGGRLGRGIAVFILAFPVAFFSIFLLLIPFLAYWVWNMYDANQVCKKYNAELLKRQV